MQKSIIFSFLLTFTFCGLWAQQTFAQQKRVPLRIQDSGWIYKFYQGEERIKYKEYLKILEADPATRVNLKRARQYRNIGLGISLTGTFFTFYGLTSTGSYNSDTFTWEYDYLGLGMMAAGIAISASAIPFTVLRFREIEKATLIYNEGQPLGNASVKREWELNPSLNGLSLSIKF